MFDPWKLKDDPIRQLQRNWLVKYWRVVNKLPYISRLVPFVSLRIAGARSAHAQPSSVPWLHTESLNLLI